MSSSEEEEFQFSKSKGKGDLSKEKKKPLPERDKDSSPEEVSSEKKKNTASSKKKTQGKKVEESEEEEESEESEEEEESEESEEEEKPIKKKATRGKKTKAKIEKKRKPKLDLENLTKSQKLELANKRKVKYNLLSMIRDRGADLEDEAEVLSTPLYNYIYEVKDVELEGDYPIGDNGKIIYVRFLTDSGKNSIVTDDVRVVMDEFRKRNKKKEEKWQSVHTLILLGEYSIHAAAKTMLTDKIVKSDIFIQFFNVRELCYNVLTHFYQPRYTKLTAEEERNLIEQGYSFNKAPHIRYADIVDEKNDKKESFCDPIVKFSGWGPENNVKEEGKNFALNCMFPDYLIHKAIRRK